MPDQDFEDEGAGASPVPDIFSKLDPAEALLVAASCRSSIVVPRGTPVMFPVATTGPQKEKSLSVWVPPIDKSAKPLQFAMMDAFSPTAMIVAPTGTILRCRLFDEHGLPIMQVYVQWVGQFDNLETEDEDEDETGLSDHEDG